MTSEPPLSDDAVALREALRPFAVAAANMDGDEPDTMSLWESPEAMMLTFGDLRAAGKALQAIEGEG